MTANGADGKVNILLVDDQPAKLLSYEVILGGLGENLLKASSATEALQILLRNDVAVLLVDVCMPDLDGFQFTSMVRSHPRFEKTAIIFISAIQISDVDSLKGYELGAVDYVPVPVVPELLRAKVRVFVDLYRKSMQLERLNGDLEERVRQRTKELEEATKRQELLAREVDHRAKNALAVVTSILRLTKARTIEEYSNSVNGRIRAMANVHSLLSESRWAGADLSRIVHDELAPFASRQKVVVQGPSVILRPAIAQTVAIVLHELVTNAAKYGALSRTAGQVMLSWSSNSEDVELSWSELGGPPVIAPEQAGFGTKVIEASISANGDGRVDFEWRESGLLCNLYIPDACEKAGDGPQVVMPTALNGHANGGRGLSGARVLLAEDEPLIAMMIADVLDASGAIVIGPFANVSNALKCDEPFDIALLDVNLEGEQVYPVAEKVRASGKPMVFATGYDNAAIDQRFADALVLQKPLDPNSVTEILGRALQR